MAFNPPNTVQRASKRQANQIVELLAELEGERSNTATMQNLHDAMLDLGNELRGGLKSKRQDDRQLRFEAQADAIEAKARLVEANVKFAALQSEKEQLELDLMDAASQILRQEAQLKAMRGSITSGLAAWQSVNSPNTPTLSEERGSQQPRLSNRLQTTDSMPTSQLPTNDSQEEAMRSPEEDLRHWEELQALVQNTCADTVFNGGALPLNNPNRVDIQEPISFHAHPPKAEKDKELLGWERKRAMHAQTDFHEVYVREEAEEFQDRLLAKNQRIMKWIDTPSHQESQTAAEDYTHDKGHELKPNFSLDEQFAPAAAFGMGTPRTKSEGQKMLEAVAKLLLSNSPEADNDEPDDLSGLASVGRLMSHAKHTAE